jgi:putative sterol carrier protein
VAKYPFLSKEWMEEARNIREEYKGKAQAIPHAIKMNLNITDVPHVDGVFQAHMDSTSGELEMEEGHMESPELTVTLDEPTAKAIFIDGNPQAGMQAFMAGKIKIEGDMTKLMVMQSAPVDPVAAEVSAKIKEITE